MASLRVVLLTLFFGAVGMMADPVWIAQNAPFVLAVAAAVVLGKAALVTLILRASGQPLGVAWATGLCLGQVGEFAFVLGNSGKKQGVLADGTYMAIVSASTVTLFLTPYLVALAPRVEALAMGWRRGRPGAAEPGGHQGHQATGPDVVIVGFGPAGQAAAASLFGSGPTVAVLDIDPAVKDAARASGFSGHPGDATHPDVLEDLHVARARMVVITVPTRSAALLTLGHVRSLAPKAVTVVRSRHQRDRPAFEDAGADAVFGDEEEIGKRLAEFIRSQLDQPTSAK